MDVKEQVKRSLSIVDVASIYVQLKPAGKNFKALCPFHSEKTPSFFVMPDRNTFTCFGCHKYGDIFTLIQEMENLTFPEAVEFLIDRFNIPVERKKGVKKSPKKDDYVQINKKVMRYFRSCLTDTEEGHRALQYLRNRGITTDTIEKFSMGYALNEWQGLTDFLRRENIPPDKAVELGLLVRKDNGRMYDRFRGRVMFPIFSESGTVIAFGGRTLFDEPSKYLNSPDTPLFKKSRNLFGLFQAKPNIREAKSVIVVEGYFDVVAMVQGGVSHVVAALGTALSAEQVHVLKRFAEEIYLFYDNDSAGMSATLRSIELMLENNAEPMVVDGGGQKDPDEIIRHSGSAGIAKMVSSATGGFDFFMGRVMENTDLSRPEKKRQAISQVMDVVDKIPDLILREEYVRRVAGLFRVSEEALKSRKKMRARFLMEENRKLLLSPAEYQFIESLLVVPEVISEISELMTSRILSVLQSRGIIQCLLNHYNESKKTFADIDRVWSELTEPERAVFQEIRLSASEMQPERDFHLQRIEQSYLNFQNILNKKMIHNINSRIRAAERENNFAEIQKLMVQKDKYVKTKFRAL